MKKLIWILSIVFGLSLLGCGLGSPGTDNASSPEIYTGGSPVPTKSTKASSQLTKADFVPSIKTKSNECFDYYGCNRTYKVQFAVDKVKLEDDGHSYEITYVVSGGADGKQTDSVTMSPDGTFVQMDGFTKVNEESTKLKVVVTEIERLAY